MLDPFPGGTIDRYWIHPARLLADESSVIRDFAVPEEACEHRKSVLGEHRVDIGLLPHERFRRAAGWQRIACIQLGIDDLRVEFVDTAKPHCGSLAIWPQWLAEHELPGAGVISQIEPIREFPCLQPHDARHRLPRAPRIDTADHKIGIGHIPSTADMARNTRPNRAPKRRCERLTHAIRFVDAWDRAAPILKELEEKLAGIPEDEQQAVLGIISKELQSWLEAIETGEAAADSRAEPGSPIS